MPDTRRTFLQSALATGSLTGSLTGCARGRATGTWRFFSSSEARTLEAVCEQLIPADRDPGAKSAGVVRYIDIQLTKAFRKHRKAYRDGLERIDADSRSRFGAVFAELSGDQQVEILRGLEQNARPFFDLVLTHTRQGFYGDPRHGGNRNRASWRMVGLDYPPIRGRQHYEGA